MTQIVKIISGGQTGVDRAALDVAIQLNIPHGGYCPAGRRAEDGAIPAQYHLIETSSSDYAERTEMNILHSDGTLILACNALQGGTKLAFELAKKYNKPIYIANAEENECDKVLEWFDQNNIEVLSIGGPRESEEPGIYDKAFVFLLELFKNLIGGVLQGKPKMPSRKVRHS